MDNQSQLGPSKKKQHDMSRAADTAYSKIKKAILAGELTHGENLSERDLAERLGVSRTPVREAINRLRFEGLVLLERNSRNYVAHYSEQDVEEILDLKALLEGHAASRAASRISDADIDRLIELAVEMEKIVEDESVDAQEAYYPINEKFHNIIISAAASPRMESILNTSLSTHFGGIGRFQSERGIRDSFRHSCRQHREIIAAFKARNEERAMSQMHAHLHSLIRVETSRRAKRELST